MGVSFSDICTPGKDCRLPDDSIKTFKSMEIPQLVLITFNGILPADISQKLFNANRRNPDDCPISMTTFASTADVDIGSAYAEIQRGMEVSLFGDIDFTNETEKSAYNKILRVKTEMAAKIPHLQKVLGWRSSDPSMAGRKLFNALSYIGFTYDSTLMVNKPRDGVSFQWPFRLTRGWTLPPCDNRGYCNQGDFPNLMEFPLTSLFSDRRNINCYTLRNCSTLPGIESVRNLLLANLRDFYIGNRAPFIIQIDSDWLKSSSAYVQNIEAFLDQLALFDDIYIVSIENAVKWLHNPYPVSRLHLFREWQCPLKSSAINKPFMTYPQRTEPRRSQDGAPIGAPTSDPTDIRRDSPLFSWNSKTRREKGGILFSPSSTASSMQSFGLTISLTVFFLQLLED